MTREKDWPRIDGSAERTANARLIVLCGPHLCDVPGCPGPKLVAKLEEADRLAALVDTAELAIRGLAAAQARLEAGEKCAAALRMIEIQSEKEALDSDDLLTWMIRIHLWASQAMAAWDSTSGATHTDQRMLRCKCGRDVAVPDPTPAGTYPCECGGRFEVYPVAVDSAK